MEPGVKEWLYVGEFDPFAIYLAKHFAYYHIAVKSKSSAKVNLLVIWCFSILYQKICLLEVVKCLIMFLDVVNDAPSQDFLQILCSFFKFSAVFLFHLLCSFLFGVFFIHLVLVRNKRALLSVLAIRSSRIKRDQHHLLSLHDIYYFEKNMKLAKKWKKMLTYVDKLVTIYEQMWQKSHFKTSLEISRIFFQKNEKSVNQKSKKK